MRTSAVRSEVREVMDIRQASDYLGISPDSVKSHAKFASKFNLPFPLLADEGHQVAEAYGMWVEKSMYGRKYMGVERSTFVIDGTGTIAAIHRKVKPTKPAGDLVGTP